MHKCDPGAPSPLARFLVDELYALVPQMIERRPDIEHGVGNMVKPFAASFQELADR